MWFIGRWHWWLIVVGAVGNKTATGWYSIYGLPARYQVLANHCSLIIQPLSNHVFFNCLSISQKMVCRWSNHSQSIILRYHTISQSTAVNTHFLIQPLVNQYPTPQQLFFIIQPNTGDSMCLGTTFIRREEQQHKCSRSWSCLLFTNTMRDPLGLASHPLMEFDETTRSGYVLKQVLHGPYDLTSLAWTWAQSALWYTLPDLTAMVMISFSSFWPEMGGFDLRESFFLRLRSSISIWPLDLLPHVHKRHPIRTAFRNADPNRQRKMKAPQSITTKQGSQIDK